MTSRVVRFSRLSVEVGSLSGRTVRRLDRWMCFGPSTRTQCGDARTGCVRMCVRGNVLWVPVVGIVALLASWSLRRLVQESVAMPGRVAHGFVRWFFVGDFSAGVLFMLRLVDVRSVSPSVLLFFVLCWVFGWRNYIAEWRRCSLVIIRPV